MPSREVALAVSHPTGLSKARACSSTHEHARTAMMVRSCSRGRGLVLTPAAVHSAPHRPRSPSPRPPPPPQHHHHHQRCPTLPPRDTEAGSCLCKHLLHVQHSRGVPRVEIAVEGARPVEHACHTGDAAHVPGRHVAVEHKPSRGARVRFVPHVLHTHTHARPGHE